MKQTVTITTKKKAKQTKKKLNINSGPLDIPFPDLNFTPWKAHHFS